MKSTHYIVKRVAYQMDGLANQRKIIQRCDLLPSIAAAASAAAGFSLVAEHGHLPVQTLSSEGMRCLNPFIGTTLA